MTQVAYQWAVVGAGPAGIAAVGKLIDSGVPSKAILWIDPRFNVGDLGHYWQHVSSNTTVGRFLDFLKASQAFQYDETSSHFRLNQLPRETTCVLNEVVEPLQWVTKQLRGQVESVEDGVQKLTLTHNLWHLHTTEAVFQARSVVLATGAQPIQLTHPNVSVIPLETALDRDKLSQTINKQETYAVFGSSHSAMIVVRELIELGVHNVINFYRQPCRYAIDLGDWIVFDNTGLKGDTAAWVKQNIDGVQPVNLSRYLSNEANLARYLPECQHVVYAVGFSRRPSFTIEGYADVIHNPHNGIIGPNLFGLGIGFPELATDPLGHVESQVGLWKFMGYLNKVLPIWLRGC